MQTLLEYFKNNDYLEIYLNENFHIFVDCTNVDKNNIHDLCIEICDKNGNSVNITPFMDITLNNLANDIKESVINYLIANYFYIHV